MAFKFSKDDNKRHAELASELNDKFSDLQTAVGEYNEAIRAAVEGMKPAIEAYNDAVREAREFVEDIVASAQEEFMEKSERWQEGDRATAINAWIERLAEFSPDDYEPPEPDELDEPDGDAPDTFENLPPDPDA